MRASVRATGRRSAATVAGRADRAAAVRSLVALLADWRDTTSPKDSRCFADRLAVQEDPAYLDRLEHVRDRGQGLGMAYEEIAAGIERVVEVLHDSARRLEPEVDRDVAAEDDVPTAHEGEWIRLLDQVVEVEPAQVTYRLDRPVTLLDRLEPALHDLLLEAWQPSAAGYTPVRARSSAWVETSVPTTSHV